MYFVVYLDGLSNSLSLFFAFFVPPTILEQMRVFIEYLPSDHFCQIAYF